MPILTRVNTTEDTTGAALGVDSPRHPATVGTTREQYQRFEIFTHYAWADLVVDPREWRRRQQRRDGTVTPLPREGRRHVTLGWVQAEVTPQWVDHVAGGVGAEVTLTLHDCPGDPGALVLRVVYPDGLRIGFVYEIQDEIDDSDDLAWNWFLALSWDPVKGLFDQQGQMPPTATNTAVLSVAAGIRQAVVAPQTWFKRAHVKGGRVLLRWAPYGFPDLASATFVSDSLGYAGCSLMDALAAGFDLRSAEDRRWLKRAGEGSWIRGDQSVAPLEELKEWQRAGWTVAAFRMLRDQMPSMASARVSREERRKLRYALWAGPEGVLTRWLDAVPDRLPDAPTASLAIEAGLTLDEACALVQKPDFDEAGLRMMVALRGGA